jgi:alkylmercury lyase
MSAPQHLDSEAPIDLAALADRFVACFPKLNAEGRRVFVALYRVLSLGEPVSAQQVAQRAGVSLHQVNTLLDAVPGVYREDGKVTGFWGLTLRKLSKHRFHTGERTLYTWCAWDALFIPMILGNTAYIESEDAQTGAPIRLTVAPDRVTAVSPRGTVVSMLEPREDMLADVVTRLCHYIHFFASEVSGRAWITKHPGTVLLSLEDAFELGRRTNQMRYGEALLNDS